MVSHLAVSPPVLIVGGGPTGLVLASELLRLGIPVRVVERERAPHEEARATVIHARSLELLELGGLAARFADEGQRLRRYATCTREMRYLGRLSFAAADTAFPYALGLQQYRTERLLCGQVERLGGSVERGVALTALAPASSDVHVELRHADGGRERARYRYVVGCDGAHSTVRAALGIDLEGGDYAATFVVAETDASWPFARDELVVFLGHDGILMCAPLPGGRTLFIGDALDADPTIARTAALDEVRDLVAARAADGVAVREVHWASRFHLHHRLAPRFADERVFLAGDAAHVCSLFGGQGMNMGFQDAVNLAWKLALTLGGRARPRLLASYDAERRAVAAQELAFTDSVHEGLFEDDHSFPERIRRHYQALVMGLGTARERKRRTYAQLALGYAGSPIVSEHDASRRRFGSRIHTRLRAGDRLPEARLRTADGSSLRLCELVRGAAHTLLLFPGNGRSDQGIDRLQTIARRVSDRYAGLLEHYVIVREARHRPDRAGILLDADHELHDAFGVDSECLYLIRPDLYVGFRCRPVAADRLVDYLDSILAPTA